MSIDPDKPLINKKIVYPGTRNVDFKPGTKVYTTPLLVDYIDL